MFISDQVEGVRNYCEIYTYNDKYCDYVFRDTVTVCPTPVSMNLKSDYCIGDIINLAAKPAGGLYDRCCFRFFGNN